MIIWCDKPELYITSDIEPVTTVRKPLPSDSEDVKKDKRLFPYLNKKKVNFEIDYLGTKYFISIEKNFTWDGSSCPGLHHIPSLLNPSMLHDAICDGCKTMVKQEVIDETVKTVLQSMTITEEQCNQLHDNFKALLKIQSNYDENRKNVISGRITKLRNRIDQLYEDKLDRLITEDVYIKKRDQWQYELDELTLEFSSLSKTNQELIKRLEIMSEPLKNLWEVYSALNDEKKRCLLKLLCPNLFYDGSKVVITIKEPFTALLKFAFFENGAGCGMMSEPNHIINYMKSNEFSILENDIKFCLLQIAA